MRMGLYTADRFLLHGDCRQNQGIGCHENNHCSHHADQAMPPFASTVFYIQFNGFAQYIPSHEYSSRSNLLTTTYDK